jgi:hypothetical protein
MIQIDTIDTLALNKQRMASTDSVGRPGAEQKGTEIVRSTAA